MKTLGELLTDWRASKAAMDKLTTDMPRIIGNECVKLVKANFKLQGYDSGFGITKWPPRTEQTNKNYKYGRAGKGKSAYKGSVYNYGNPILLQTRNLYNSVKYIISGNMVLIGCDLNLVPYAQKMNEGGQGRGWHDSVTNTPARQFIPRPGQPPNPKMLKAIEKKMLFERDKALKLFKR